MRVTQKQMAQKLGLSPSLVSRALAGTAHRIGADPDTVQRIQAMALELGYVPNAAARQLRGAGQPVLGLVVMDLEDPFFGPAVAEVIRQSHQAGYALSLAGFERRKAEAGDIQLLLQQDLTALLVLGSGPLDWVKPFLARRVRVLRIGSGHAPPDVLQVTQDEAWGLKLVVDHLVELGHRDIAFIGVSLPAHEHRLELVRQQLKRHHLKLRPAQGVLAGTDVLEAGARGVAQLAAREPWPSAIICSSDAVALGVLRAVARHGLRVPNHVSVTGYDDLALAALVTPPLTSVRQPLSDMVQQALALAAPSRSPASPPPHRPRLVVRESTAAAWNA